MQVNRQRQPDGTVVTTYQQSGLLGVTVVTDNGELIEFPGAEISYTSEQGNVALKLKVGDKIAAMFAHGTWRYTFRSENVSLLELKRETENEDSRESSSPA